MQIILDLERSRIPILVLVLTSRTRRRPSSFRAAQNRPRSPSPRIPRRHVPVAGERTRVTYRRTPSALFLIFPALRRRRPARCLRRRGWNGGGFSARSTSAKLYA